MRCPRGGAYPRHMSSSLLPTRAPQPVRVDETCERIVSFSRASIAEFAKQTGDANPLHFDPEAAARAHHGRIIASGQQTTSNLIGLAATHFARRCEQFTRELLCLNFNFAFKAPVFADDPVQLSWTVSSVQWHPKLEGWLAQADGKAVSHARLCVVARGTLLVKAREF
jgi:acyl dehydratase